MRPGYIFWGVRYVDMIIESMGVGESPRKKEFEEKRGRIKEKTNNSLRQEEGISVGSNVTKNVGMVKLKYAFKFCYWEFGGWGISLVQEF